MEKVWALVGQRGSGFPATKPKHTPVVLAVPHFAFPPHYNIHRSSPTSSFANRCRTPVPTVCCVTPKHVRSSGFIFSTAAETLQVTSATSVASNARAAPWTRAAARTVLNLMSDARTLGRRKEAQALYIPRRLVLHSSRRLQTRCRPVIQPDPRLHLTALMSQGLIVEDLIVATRPAPQPREAGLSPLPQPGKLLREPPTLSSGSCSLRIMKRSTQCEPFAPSNSRKLPSNNATASRSSTPSGSTAG